MVSRRGCLRFSLGRLLSGRKSQKHHVFLAPVDRGPSHIPILFVRNLRANTILPKELGTKHVQHEPIWKSPKPEWHYLSENAKKRVMLSRVANKKWCWCWRCVRHRDQSFEWHPKLWEAHRNLTLNFCPAFPILDSDYFLYPLNMWCVNTCTLYLITVPFCLSRSRTLDSSNARRCIFKKGWTWLNGKCSPRQTAAKIFWCCRDATSWWCRETSHIHLSQSECIQRHYDGMLVQSRSFCGI